MGRREAGQPINLRSICPSWDNRCQARHPQCPIYRCQPRRQPLSTSCHTAVNSVDRRPNTTIFGQHATPTPKPTLLQDEPEKKSYFVAPSSQIDSLFILTPINFILTSNPIKITDYNWRLIPFNTIVDYLHDTFQFQLPEGQLGIFFLGANISSSKYSMFVDNGALLWDFCRRYVEWWKRVVSSRWRGVWLY